VTIFSGLQLPRVIYETESEINGKIMVIDVGETRKLSVGGFIQSVNPDSPSISRTVWGRVIDIMKENEPGLRSVMILGLGGGTMAHLISRAFPGISITSVELDSVVFEVAKKFFAVESIRNHKIIVNDALRVVASPEEFGIGKHSLGCIIVDIYCGEEYPNLGTTGSFFDGIKNVVAPGGFVVFSRIYLGIHQDDVNRFIQIVETHFLDVQSLIIAGKTNSDNVLIYGRA